MENNNYTIALLIDAENINSKYISALNKELIMFGRVTYKRMYGDFTGTMLQPWKNVINEHAITPVQQFSYTQGKNATDSKIIIDAMDILYSGNVDAFCIMSSDSDYTGLVKRLKESNIFVIGAGEKKSPRSFVNACNKFLSVEELLDKYGEPVNEIKETVTDIKEESENIEETVTVCKEITEKKVSETDSAVEQETLVGEEEALVITPKEEIEQFAYHFLESQADHIAPLEMVLWKITQAYPDFSITKYGVKKSYDFFSKERFWTKRSEKGTHMYIGLCEETSPQLKENKEKKIVTNIDKSTQKALIRTAQKILKGAGKPLAIGDLCTKIYKDEYFSSKNPNFKFAKGQGKKFFEENGFSVTKNQGGTVIILLLE